MKLFIAILMICLLKKDVGCYSCFLKLSIILNSCCCYININSSDCTILMLNVIYCINAFKYIIYRIVHRVFPCLYGKSLMSHILECSYFLLHFLHCKLFPWNMSVLSMIWTIYTSINTIIGQIKWRKHYYPVTIKILLDLFCQIIYLFNLFRLITG